jgi:predicted MPP superfamily phosphohydrolase
MSKVFRYNYDQHIAIYPLGDMHIGSPNCDMDRVHRIIDKITEDDNLFCVLLGDQLDMALAGSKSDVYTATQTPGKAVIQVANLLRPLAERRKILAMMDGDHEERLARIAGISPTEMIAEMLGLQDKYTPTTAVLHFVCKNHSHVVYASHGNGGGGRIGGKANQLERLSWIIDADVVMAGHTHTPMVFRQKYMKIDPQNGQRKETERLFINCASCLSYAGSYGDVKGYVPSSNIYPVLHFFPDKDRPTPFVTM